MVKYLKMAVWVVDVRGGGGRGGEEVRCNAQEGEEPVQLVLLLRIDLVQEHVVE